MESKIDKSLTEVLEMKEKNYKDFKKSGCKSYIQYLSDEMEKAGFKAQYVVKEPEQNYC